MVDLSLVFSFSEMVIGTLAAYRVNVSNIMAGETCDKF